MLPIILNGIANFVFARASNRDDFGVFFETNFSGDLVFLLFGWGEVSRTENFDQPAGR